MRQLGTAQRAAQPNVVNAAVENLPHGWVAYRCALGGTLWRAECNFDVVVGTKPTLPADEYPRGQFLGIIMGYMVKHEYGF